MLNLPVTGGDFIRILSAIYEADSGEKKENHPRELTSRIYEKNLKIDSIVQQKIVLQEFVI